MIKKIALLILLIYACYSFAQTDAAKEINLKSTPYRVSEWLPSDQAILDAWVKNLILETKTNDRELLPVVAEFKEFIENDPELYMYFHQI